MYIKIKTIKQSLLILACLFFAGFNYLTFVKADNATALDSDKDGLTDAEEQLYATDANNADTDGDGYSDGVEIKSGYDPLKPAPGDRIATINNPSGERTSTSNSAQTSDLSLTDKFIQDFSQYIESKKDQSISAEEIKTFTDSALSSSIGGTTTTLPEIDRSQLRILSQSYPGLSAKDKKQKIQEDATKYISQIVYLLANNAPKVIATNDDWTTFQDDFTARLADPTSLENSIYFSDMGNRLELFSIQFNNLEVPETMIELHVKFAQISQGFIDLRNLPSTNSANDPLGKMLILTRAKDMMLILADYFTNDLSDYLKQIQ